MPKNWIFIILPRYISWPSHFKFERVHWSQFSVDIIHALHIIWNPFGQIRVRKFTTRSPHPVPMNPIGFLGVWMTIVGIVGIVGMHAQQNCRRSFINSNERLCLQIHISLFNTTPRQGNLILLPRSVQVSAFQEDSWFYNRWHVHPRLWSWRLCRRRILRRPQICHQGRMGG